MKMQILVSFIFSLGLMLNVSAATFDAPLTDHFAEVMKEKASFDAPAVVMTADVVSIEADTSSFNAKELKVATDIGSLDSPMSIYIGPGVTHFDTGPNLWRDMSLIITDRTTLDKPPVEEYRRARDGLIC